jgi:hypothetical protein
MFVPMYWVAWFGGPARTEGLASVHLFAPAKTLLQLSVDDPEYIRRAPLLFTNLASLFPQTNAAILVITNWPKPKIIDMSGPPGQRIVNPSE